MLAVPAIASASTLVVVTRLSRISAIRLLECGLPTVGVPARLTTTSAASITSRSRVPAYGSQVDSPGPDAGGVRGRDGVPALPQLVGEVAAQEPRGAGDDDVQRHAITLSQPANSR